MTSGGHLPAFSDRLAQPALWSEFDRRVDAYLAGAGGPAGPDCPNDAADKKAQRAREKRQWKDEAQKAMRERA